MADKFTIFGNSGSTGPDTDQENNSLDDKFFEEFAFDDFDYDDFEENPDEPDTDRTPVSAQPVQVNTPAQNVPAQNVPVQSTPVQKTPAQSTTVQKTPVQKTPTQSTPVQNTAARNKSAGQPEEVDSYAKILKDADQWAQNTEIEPDDPMLSEFESALAAEIQRVTREQEAEKKKIAAVRAARRAENEPTRRAIDERNSQAHVSGESIRTGGWFEVEKRGGWSRRRRASQAAESAGEGTPYSAGAGTPEPSVSGSKTENQTGSQSRERSREEEARKLAREQERAREAALRAERVKAAQAEYAEAERQAALAREREAEAKRRAAELRSAEQEEIKRKEAEKKMREEEEQKAFAAALQEEKERLEREEAEKKQHTEMKVAEQSNDDDDDDDDDDEGKGRTVVTVSVILILLILGVGAMMTYFWSNLSVSRPENNANTEAPAAEGETQEAAAENGEEAAVESMTAEESRYLEDSRAAQEAFEEEQAAALARAEELEQEERAAKLAEAGMLGLPDISTRDLSEFLTEMPAEGTSICSTDSVMYSYDQMVKDLYFLTVQYGDFITTNIIGTTLDQRAIYEAVIGSANASKHVVVYYALEGTDYIDTVLAMNQLEVYCKARKNGTTYKNHTLDSIFADVCIHVVPMANPDGVSICQYGIDALRTDEARTALQAAYDADVAAGLTADPIETYVLTYRANANGVDLNSNFDIGWEEYTSGPASPSSSGYKGSAALSEPESQALVQLVESVSTAAVIGYGTNGQTVEYGYGYEGPAAQGVASVTDIGFDGLVTALTGKTGYAAAEMPKYDATQAGGASEYFMYVKSIPAVTVKAGTGDTPLDDTQMSSVWQANSEVLQMFGNLYTNGL